MAQKLFDLSGKVALVTGGNGGIGLGMAAGLAQAGAKIAIWGQNAEKNRIAEEKLRALTRDVLVQSIDVADEQAVTSGIAEVVRTMGRWLLCWPIRFSLLVVDAQSLGSVVAAQPRCIQIVVFDSDGMSVFLRHI